MAWTDGRLQERFDGIDRRFDTVDRRFDEVDRRFDEVDRKFDVVDRRFDRVENQIVELRIEMRSEIGAIRSILSRLATGTVVGLIVVVATVFAKGG